MQVTLEVPEPVAQALGYGRETLPRRALEALLVDECARGVPYPAKTRADDAMANASLPKAP